MRMGPVRTGVPYQGLDFPDSTSDRVPRSPIPSTAGRRPLAGAAVPSGTPAGRARRLRDYIHVVDLADAHVRALRRLERNAASTIYNVGTERPSSVRDVLASVERVTGRTVVRHSALRRPGDPAVLFASADR